MFLFLSVSVVYGLPWKTLIRFYKFFDTRHPNVTCGRTAYSMSYPHRNAAHPLLCLSYRAVHLRRRLLCALYRFVPLRRMVIVYIM